MQDVFPAEIFATRLQWNDAMRNRMNARAARILDPGHGHIEGKAVLDLGARDGRWSWAALRAGAATAVGIEGRAESIRQGTFLFEDGLAPRYTVRQGDAFAVLNRFQRNERRFDTVLCLGFLYHVYDHWALLRAVAALGPHHVVVDSEMEAGFAPFVRVRRENVDHPNNAIPEADLGRTGFVPVGNPSQGTVAMIGECLGYRVEWCDWTLPDGPARLGLDDYAAGTRYTCIWTRA